MIVVTPRNDIKQIATIHGDMSGVVVVLSLKHGEKWIAEKSDRYWWLRRKGSAISIRLINRMIDKLFEEVDA